MMGVIAVVLFGGITVLAVALHAQALPDGDPSVISQIAAAVFGGVVGGVLPVPGGHRGHPDPGREHRVQRLSRVWPRSWPGTRYLPRQLHNRGDRLVFSNGVVLLAAAAVAR